MCSHIHATVPKCRAIRLPDSDITSHIYSHMEDIHKIMSLCFVHGKPLSSCSVLAAVSMLRAPALHGQFFSVDIVLCFYRHFILYPVSKPLFPYCLSAYIHLCSPVFVSTETCTPSRMSSVMLL